MIGRIQTAISSGIAWIILAYAFIFDTSNREVVEGSGYKDYELGMAMLFVCPYVFYKTFMEYSEAGN